MNLIGGSQRPPEQGESYMGEDALLWSARRPVFALHDAVVGGGAAKGDAIPLIVGAHAGEGAAAGDASFEMVMCEGSRVGAAG
jgi:hypothetical protein